MDILIFTVELALLTFQTYLKNCISPTATTSNGYM